MVVVLVLVVLVVCLRATGKDLPPWAAEATTTTYGGPNPLRPRQLDPRA